MSLYLGTNLISGVATPIEGARNIGQILQSTLPLTDAGLHLLDGALISGSGSYSDFVDYIANLYNNDDTEIMYAWKANDESDADYVYTKTTNIKSSTVLYNADGTIYNKADYPRYEIFKATISGDYHVWYFLTAEGSSSGDYRERSSVNSEENIYNFSQNFLTTEKEWQTSVTTYGVCGKFVYDSTNNTVRLPKITGFTEGTIDPTVLGNLTEAGLPNITGSFTNENNAEVGDTGAFYKDSASRRNGRSGNDNYNDWNYFDASRSNPIYGNSSTVQPQAIKVLYYIVIATSIKTDIQVDIDEIATDLNNKVSIQDLSTIHCVIDTYQNGTDWYRIYDDGWVEQGGIIEQLPDIWTIEFLKPFADSSYMLQGEQWGTDATGNLGILTQSETNANGNHTGSGTIKVTWYACGYGA